MSGGQGFSAKRFRVGAPRTGSIAVRVQGTSYGGSMCQPIEGGNGGLQSVSGGGSILIEQLGCVAMNGTGGSRLPIQALQFPVTSGGFVAASTIIPAPDFSAGIGTGVTSLTKIATIVTGTDWIGDFDSAPDGVVFGIFNQSGGGQALNLCDVTVGGSIYLPAPYVALGFSETAFFFKYNTVTRFLFKSSSNYFQGGFTYGSRVTTTTNATPAMLYRMPRASGVPNNIASFVCNVTANNASTGALIGKWIHVAAGWDDTHTQDIGVAGVPAVQWQNVPGAAALTVDDDGTFYRLLGTGIAATNVRWNVNGWTCSLGQQ